MATPITTSVVCSFNKAGSTMRSRNGKKLWRYSLMMPRPIRVLGMPFYKRACRKRRLFTIRRAVEIDPSEVSARNNMAWVLATSSDPSIRNGAMALNLARQAVEISGGKDAIFFRTLAASYGECGKFADAIAAAEKGEMIAISRGDSHLARTFEKDIALYRADIPLHQAALH